MQYSVVVHKIVLALRYTLRERNNCEVVSTRISSQEQMNVLHLSSPTTFKISRVIGTHWSESVLYVVAVNFDETLATDFVAEIS